MSRASANVSFSSFWKKGFALLIVFVIAGFFVFPTLQVSANHEPGHPAPSGGSTAGEAGLPDLQVTDTLLSYCTGEGAPSGVTNIMLCGASLIISLVLEIIVWFLGMMILLVISVLMGFAVYNDFNSAAIVQTGWVIIRDLTNMFFIVILLVSAFATIIGYDTASFHYKKVLPKLLLMAVLVNFSKTIILLLVDFSQVIMLTFVNAFYQSAAGNFVNGLGLNTVLRLPGSGTAGGTAGGSPPSVSMFNIVLALALSVVLLSIMLATMIILTMYIMVRIIGIWIALIFSPAAFLATALPDRLKRGMGAITSDYWSKLVGLLTGGPVIAFFLWLTLSTIQQAGGSGGGLAPAMNLGNQEAVAWLFPTDAGNSNAIASFIVGITLMLMGVGVAVQAAQSASSTFGSLASKIAGAGTKYGGKLALGGLAAPALALYGGARVGAAGARGIDRRTDLSGRAARGLLKVPGVRTAFRQPLLKGATLRRRESGEKKAREAKYLKHLSAEEQASVSKAYGKTGLSSFGERAAASQVLGMVTSEKGQKERVGAKTSELMKSMKYSGMTDQEEAKRLASMEAKEEIRQGSAALIKQGLGMAKDAGDFSEVEKFQKQLAKDPQLSDDLEKQMGKMRADPEKLKDMSKEAKQNFAVALNALPTGAMQLSSDKKTVEGFDQPSLERFYEQNAGNKELVETVKLAVEHVQKSDGQGVSKEELMSMQKQRASDGTVKLYGKGKDKGYEQKFNAQYEKSRGGVKKAFEGGGGASNGKLSQEASASVNDALAQGVQISDIVEMAGNQNKQPLGDHLSSVSSVSVIEAATATDKGTFDEKIQDAINQWRQVDKVDSDLQVKILSGVQSGGGAKMIAQKWDLADGSQRQAMQKLVKQAVLRAAETAKKRAAGQTVSAQEQQVEALVTELRKEMPRSKSGNTKAAPAAIRQVLHDGEK